MKKNDTALVQKPTTFKATLWFTVSAIALMLIVRCLNFHVDFKIISWSILVISVLVLWLGPYVIKEKHDK